MISREEFKEKGWKYQRFLEDREEYILKNNIILFYNAESKKARINIIKFSGKEETIANIVDFNQNKLSDVTEVLELNYVELLKQILRDEQ